MSSRTHLIRLFALAALGMIVVVGVGCPTADPPEALCTQIDVLPQDPALPADGVSYTYIDVAVCACPADGDTSPCAEDDLMKGRTVYMAADRGSLTPGDSLHLVTGQAQLQLASSDRQETGVVTVWTSDGFTGAGSVQFIGPLVIETETLALEAGGDGVVEVVGSIPPVIAEVPEGAPLTAEFDATGSLLTVVASPDIYVDEEISVTVVDAMEQTGSLTVSVAALYVEDTSLAISPSYAYMAQGDPALTFEAVNATEPVYWSSAYSTYLLCDGLTFEAANCTTTSIQVNLQDDPWNGDPEDEEGLDEITFWVTDDDGAQAAATIGHL